MADKQIDWKEIHRRLEAANIAISGGSSESLEERKRILKARADILAQEPEKTKDGEYLEVVEFLLSNEHYGIESRYVREVYPLKEYTSLPCTPAFVLGLLNVRGRIISVVNIKRFFDMPEKGISDLNKIIIVHNDNMEFGILADSILGLRSIAMSAIRPPLLTLTGIHEEFLSGVTSERMVILSAEKLLSDKAIIVDEQV